MRNLQFAAMSSSDVGSVNGAKIDAGQLYAASFCVTCSDTDAAGTVKIQASNDPCAFGNVAVDFTPTNWFDVASATATVTAGVAATPIRLSDLCFRWLRVVFTSSNTGTGVITVNMNGQGF